MWRPCPNPTDLQSDGAGTVGWAVWDWHYDILTYKNKSFIWIQPNRTQVLFLVNALSKVFKEADFLFGLWPCGFAFWIVHFTVCYFIPLQCPFPCLTYFRDPAMCSTKSLVIFVEAEVEWSPIPKLRPWICSLFTGFFNSPGLSFLISKMNRVHESQGLPMPLTFFPVLLYRLLVQPFTFPSMGPLLYQQLHQPLAHLKDATLGKMHKLFLTLCPLPLLLLILGQTRWGGWVRGKLSNQESCHRGRSQI